MKTGNMDLKQQKRDVADTRMVVLIAVLMVWGVAACNDSPTRSSNDENDDNYVVTMESASFSPADIEVPVGTTVTWENDSSVEHTVTSGSDGDHDGYFDSGMVSPGETYTYTFDEAGTFEYYCIPHLDAGMTGTVTVVNGNENEGNGDNGGNGNGY